jgi:hypothetical protein
MNEVLCKHVSGNGNFCMSVAELDCCERKKRERSGRVRERDGRETKRRKGEKEN